ncbi:MAG: NADH:flavin oxidoreductase/NADH oxidase family protein [Burkholderiaceae bacterium]
MDRQVSGIRPAMLGDPLTLPCGAVLPNRLAKAALTEGLADALNRATPQHQALYQRWSRGGAGLVITGNVQVDRRFLERPGNVVIDRDGGLDGAQHAAALDALRAYARAGTVGGNHLWMQINHPGRQTPIDVHPSPLAPSAVPLPMPGFGEPRALTDEQIVDIIDRFAYVASVAQQTGFTGVQIHAAHGYLLSQFLSPLANRRDDRWGGPLENRARLLLSIVREVRERVGPAFPISVKLNSADFQKGGFDDDESRRVVGWLEQAGVDLLEVSGGNYEQPQFIVAGRGRGGGADPMLETVRESTRLREAYFLDYAVAMRAATRMPLMVTGGFRSADAMRRALADGALDVVGLGRPLITAPAGCAGLLDGSLDALPAFERSLRPEVPADVLAARPSVLAGVKGWGVQGWFCVQLLRMGEGQDPDPAISVYDAYQRYRANEDATLRGLSARPPAAVD